MVMNVLTKMYVCERESERDELGKTGVKRASAVFLHQFM